MTLASAPSRTATPSRGRRSDFTMLRLALLSVLIYVVLGLVGFAVLAGFWPPPSESLGPTGIADYFRSHDTALKIGMVMMAAGAPWYLVWSTALSKIISRIEGPLGPLSTVELLGGLLTGLVTMVPAIIWLTAAFRIETRSDHTIGLFYDFGWMFFDVTFMCSLIQDVALGTAFLSDRRSRPLFPRWVGWLNFLTGATYVPLSVMPFFHTGVFAWHGLLNFWAVFVIFFVQIAVVTPYAWKALARLEAEEPDGPRADALSAP